MKQSNKKKGVKTHTSVPEKGRGYGGLTCAYDEGGPAQPTQWHKTCLWPTGADKKKNKTKKVG